jgi:23S rRNA (pseudouridine1915-N3)-methyltransferase
VRLLIAAVGHRQPDWVDTAFAEYAKRMPREARIELVEIKPEARPDNAGEAAVRKLLEKEALRIEAALPPGATRVALTERGEALTTRALSRALEGWMGDGRDVAFLVGSADGLHPDLESGAARRLALSALTLPHGLARVLLAEQLYRALSLLKGHPYHRD